MTQPICVECGEAATVLLKPHFAPYESALCAAHSDEMLRKLAEAKESYTFHHVAVQPTPEEELRATIGRLEHEKAVQFRELMQLREHATKFPGEPSAPLVIAAQPAPEPAAAPEAPPQDKTIVFDRPEG